MGWKELLGLTSRPAREAPLPGPRCQFCLKTHPVGQVFKHCQGTNCRAAPQYGLCVCEACYVALLRNPPGTDVYGMSGHAPSMSELNEGHSFERVRRPQPAPVALVAGPIDPRALREAFEAVANAPSADAPRRVVADLLLEADDQYGQFINLQLERAARATGQGPTMRENQLRLTHAGRWLPPGVALKGAGFARGFLASASLVGPTDPEHPAWLTVEALNCFDASADALLAQDLPRLRELVGVSATTAHTLAASPNAARITSLDLSMRWEAVEQLAPLWPRLASLTRLGMVDLELDDDRFSRLLRLTAALSLAQLTVPMKDLSLTVVRGAVKQQPDRAIALRANAHAPRPTVLTVTSNSLVLSKGSSYFEVAGLVFELLRHAQIDPKSVTQVA